MVLENGKKESVASNEARSNNVVQGVGESRLWGFENDCGFLLATGIKYKYPRLPNTL